MAWTVNYLSGVNYFPITVLLPELLLIENESTPSDYLDPASPSAQVTKKGLPERTAERNWNRWRRSERFRPLLGLRRTACTWSRAEAVTRAWPSPPSYLFTIDNKIWLNIIFIQGLFRWSLTPIITPKKKKKDFSGVSITNTAKCPISVHASA